MTDLHICDLFTLHIFERFRQNLEIGAGVALGGIRSLQWVRDVSGELKCL